MPLFACEVPLLVTGGSLGEHSGEGDGIKVGTDELVAVTGGAVSNCSVVFRWPPLATAGAVSFAGCAGNGSQKHLA